MDRAEAIRELTQWRDQMKSHGVPNYGKKLTALDLAIKALKDDTHSPMWVELATGTRELSLEEWQEIDRAIRGDAESATTTDCISRADIEYHTQLEANGNGQYEEVEVAYKSDIDNLPPVNQKQITGKLESVENATSEGEESTMDQPKSKLDCISRQQAVEAIEREIDKDYDRNDITDKCYRMTLRLARNIIQDMPSLPPVTPTERTEWIPVSERLPKDLEEVVVTWVNRNPPVYYRHEKDKAQTGIAVLHRDTWHWWDSTIVDVLAEYGSRCEIEHISEDIEIIAWQPLPDPYKGGDTE